MYRIWLVTIGALFFSLHLFSQSTIDKEVWGNGFNYSSGGTSFLGDKKYNHIYDVDIYSVNFYRRIFNIRNWAGNLLVLTCFCLDWAFHVI